MYQTLSEQCLLDNGELILVMTVQSSGYRDHLHTKIHAVMHDRRERMRLEPMVFYQPLGFGPIALQ